MQEPGKTVQSASANLHALLTLWNARRRYRPMPLRLDFMPMDLHPWVCNIALVDIMTDNGPIFRFCGVNLQPRFGGERTGQRVAELDESVGRSFRFSVEQVLENHRPLLTVHDGGGTECPPFLELCMPLSDTGMHIGALVFASYPVHSIADAQAIVTDSWDYCNINATAATDARP